MSGPRDGSTVRPVVPPSAIDWRYDLSTASFTRNNEIISHAFAVSTFIVVSSVAECGNFVFGPMPRGGAFSCVAPFLLAVACLYGHDSAFEYCCSNFCPLLVAVLRRIARGPFDMCLAFMEPIAPRIALCAAPAPPFGGLFALFLLSLVRKLMVFRAINTSLQSLLLFRS